MTVYRKLTHTDQYLHFTNGHTTSNTNVVWFTPCTERQPLLPMIQTNKKLISHVKSTLCANGYTEWIFRIPPSQKKAKPVASSSETKHQFVYVCHKWEEHQERYSRSLNLMGFISSTSLLLRKHVLTHCKILSRKIQEMWCHLPHPIRTMPGQLLAKAPGPLVSRLKNTDLVNLSCFQALSGNGSQHQPTHC